MAIQYSVGYRIDHAVVKVSVANTVRPRVIVMVMIMVTVIIAVLVVAEVALV